jgi:hypothetical protein
VAGTGLGAWCARYLRAYLFGVTPWDAPAFLLTLVVAVMIAVVTALVRRTAPIAWIQWSSCAANDWAARTSPAHASLHGRQGAAALRIEEAHHHLQHGVLDMWRREGY